ncbi:MAG TPA: putative zinc-binding metallopeptidase [Vicinamibacterales bacterium]|nr:putative zinc-binding metallopeptidase [Vicinamibacterales bacterium]
MARAQLRDGWPDLSDEELLDVRMSDLPLAIEGTLGGRIAQLRAELDARDLRFPLHFYLSDEWFTPDGATAIAIPFYLSHPRLEKLEEAQMLEVEGGEHEWCMRILRHEAGHAIDNAFRLRRRRQRQHTFGSPSQPYPEFYTPKPYSKSFVLHLDSWYAQSHPDEDFAETFAVWLTPNSEWRQRYAGWRALGKLEYMDSLMDSLAGATAPVQNSEEVDPLNALRSTLRQHYRNKRRYYGVDYPNFYDRDLRRLFSDAPQFANAMSAAQFINRIRRSVRRLVSGWTGIYQYTIDQVLEDMIARCRELNLRLAVPEDQGRQEFTVLLTVQAMNYLHSGGHRLFL